MKAAKKYCTKTNKVKDPCRLIKGPAKAYCQSGNSPSSGPSYSTAKPNVPLPPSDGAPSGPVPTTRAMPPEVTGPLTTVLRWTAWCVFGGCVFGVTAVGFQMTIRHRSGEIGAHATGLAWVGFACFVAASASAIIGNVLG